MSGCGYGSSNGGYEGSGSRSSINKTTVVQVAIWIGMTFALTFLMWAFFGWQDFVRLTIVALLFFLLGPPICAIAFDE